MADCVKVSVMDENANTKFIHSVKPPKLYKDASKILKEVSQMKCSFKTCFYNKIRHNRHKTVYALVTETMKYSSLLDDLIDNTSLSKETRLDRELAKVLIFELLFGKKILSGNSKPVLKIMENKKDLEKGLKRVLKKKCVENVDDLIVRVSLPVYVRINTLKTSIDEFINYLEGNGRYEIKYELGTSYEEYIKLVKLLDSESFIRDYHLADVLVFPYKTSYQQCEFYQEGKIKIQDKASCFPAALLDPLPGSTVIDACAAPGMKTTQLAALMENNGQILAVEKDSKRMEILENNLSLSGVTCTSCSCLDFTSIDPKEEPYCNAEYILVDPSCSGSGMANRLLEGSATTTSVSADRLNALAVFQAKCLKHALSFPNVKRIVYSTCSFSTEENEAVVSEALTEYRDEFHIIRALPQWPRRGIKEGFRKMSRAIRTDPKLDLTGGFFVAVIERKTDV